MPDQKVIQALPTIVQRLRATYPNARYELNYETPLQLLVATILAAQCTDERVNQVTPALFKKYPDAKAYATADIEGLAEDLKPTGFYRQKARTVQAVCRALVEHFAGEVPRSMEEMVTLPGVARKTANVVLNNAFQLPTGVIVDTHVQRVSQRMGLTDNTRPEKIELDLMKLVPEKEWIFFGPAMVLLGRYTCTAYHPRCADCIMKDLCPKLGVGEEVDEGADEALEAEEEPPAMATKKTRTTRTRATSTKTKATAAKSAPAPAAVDNGPPSLAALLPADWQAVLADELKKPSFKKLEQFVAAERKAHTVFPAQENLFSAFRATPFDKVKVVLLGQDPYHDDGQAHGMSFSVLPGVKVPPSLVNMYKELQDDLGCKPPAHGFLGSWAHQGVLLLNTVLTVRAHEPGSHKEQGWEPFTDAVIKALNARATPVVFLLWGNAAQAKSALIDLAKHRVLTAAHPSPLSAKKFFGSKPFSQANMTLKSFGQAEVNWQIPANPAELPTPAPAPARPTPPPAVQTAARGVPVPTPAPAPAPVKEPPTHLETLLPADWREALAEEVKKPYFRTLDRFLTGERKDATVYPAEADVFAALRLTPLWSLRVVFVGPEPQADQDVADGLAFSVREDVDPSHTLTTLFKEVRDDVGCRMPVTGSLAPWARQGVLLLNTVLTVRAGRPNAHKDKGWETFTDAVCKVVNARRDPAVFVLLGAQARKKQGLIDTSRHAVLAGEHPGIAPEKFLGSRLFSEINTALELRGLSSIYWQLPFVL
jgi:uracil-DNA glycosylase/endonuclease III